VTRARSVVITIGVRRPRLRTGGGTVTIGLELDTILLSQDGGCGAATGEWADVQVVGD
jgi:hypothetical protein